MKNSFVFYTEWIEQIRLLEKHGTQKDLDAFWEAIRAYVEEGAADPETAMAELTFVPLRNQIARDAAKYEEISEKRRQARTNDNKQEQTITKHNKQEQTITNHNKQEQKPTNATEDEDDDEDDDVSPKGDVLDVCAEPLIGLPLNDGSEHPVTAEDVEEYHRLYPAVDVMQQLRNMRGWLLANPARKKTRRGIRAFISTWLQKEQDHPTARSGTTTRKMTAEEIFNLPAINPWSEVSP